MDSPVYTLRKAERLSSRKALDALFVGGNPSLSAYPLRVVYMRTTETGTRMMVSVSKRYFKRAVRRNRIKRQIREAYRLQKSLLAPAQGGVNMAFLWTSSEILPTRIVFHKVQNLLLRIHEALSAPSPNV